jgi:hypothetical protein
MFLRNVGADLTDNRIIIARGRIIESTLNQAATYTTPGQKGTHIHINDSSIS